MQILFEPSGTHVQKEQLKIRLDLYPDVGEKSYVKNYVYLPVIPPEGYPGKIDNEGNPLDQKDYDNWITSLPHIWQLNPCLCIFVNIGQNITKESLTQWCGDILTKNVLATIDDSMTQINSAHLISPYMCSKTDSKVTLSTSKTLSLDDKQKTEIDSILSGFSIGGQSGGSIKKLQPKSIDIGSEAIDRTGSGGLGSTVSLYTRVDANNAANATGTLDTVEMWFATATTPNVVWAGTLSFAGTTGTCRDSESVGQVSAGSKLTFTSLNIDVVTDDVIGATSDKGTNSCAIESTASGSGWRVAADVMDANDSATFTAATVTYSLYGTGTESGGTTIYPIWHSVGSGIATGIGTGIN